MPFTLPTFNLTVDIYSGPWTSKSLRLSSPANFAFGRRVQQQYQDAGVPDHSVCSFQQLLLLPPLTDIRSGILVLFSDVVEVPSGSGRWYGVFAVDDIGKGFPNEHRAAVVTQISHLLDPTLYPGLLWPVPMP